MSKFTPMTIEDCEFPVLYRCHAFINGPTGNIAGVWCPPGNQEEQEAMEFIVRACNNFDAMLEALRKCEIAMDTAAMHGLPQQMPPSYRDSWASAHIAARAVIAQATRPTGESPEALGDPGSSPDTRRVEEQK